MTFDKQGVSQHHNHAAIPSAVALLPKSIRPRSFSLKTHGIPDKYTGPLAGLSASAQYTYQGLTELLVPAFKYFTGLGPGISMDALVNKAAKEYVADGSEHLFVNNLKGYFAAVGAMRKHASQMVWFRWGHLAASRYMWVNELVEIK